MQKLIFPHLALLLLAPVFSPSAQGQCTDKVSHLSGTQPVGCTNVTVTSDGSVGSTSGCGKDPYFIGATYPGSYTFTFSPAISGVSVSVYAVNNYTVPNSQEEVAFYVNGSFYPITNPGVPDGCLPPAVISPTGTIRGCTQCSSSWDNIVINTPMTSLKVEDVYLGGPPYGVVFSLNLCCPICPTDAGELVANPIQVCAGATVTAPPVTQSVLDFNDVLQYVLFSNPSDTVGSIIATSNTPAFAFNPVTMQTGVTYYLAAVAGNNLNGNVNLNDPCIDFSNAAPVIWRPRPTVAFSIANPNVCAGQCTAVTATFTGTPPFNLVYSTPAAGVLTQAFLTNTGTFQVCIPPGGAPGGWSVQATGLTDAYCNCN